MRKENKRFNGLEILTVDKSNNLFNVAIDFCQRIYYREGILKLGYKFPESSEKIHIVQNNLDGVLGTLAYSVKKGNKFFLEKTTDFKAEPGSIEMGKFAVYKNWPKELLFIITCLFWRSALCLKQSGQLHRNPIYFFICPNMIKLFQTAINLKTEEVFRLKTADVSELSTAEAQKTKNIFEYIHDEYRVNYKDVFEHIPGVKITTYPPECKGFFEKNPLPDLFKVKLIK